jgi:ABC-2 type transport system ATP-binding protein
MTESANPQTATTSAIRCRELRKRYDDVVALDGLSFEILSGECFGLLGPNGAGKTTAVEILEGLNRPDSGEVELLGMRWHRGHDQALRESIGVQLQETQLADKLTVYETLRLFRSFYARGRELDDVIAQVGLEQKQHARVHKLSGGQKQRLALGCALVGEPKILFLDEPTTGLDPQARHNIWEVVEAFRQKGGTVLLTTHYMEEAAHLCGRVAIIDHGRIKAEGAPEALIAALGAEQIVDLRSQSPIAIEPLHALPGVVATKEHNGALRVRLTKVGEALPALLHELGRQGAVIEQLTTHEPTLDDVFVNITGRGLRDG